ncbi:HDOD domain-containing protein [Aliarcobacter lanthieri]|uniref:HDOD domain-containing protein n=1 Tax=Arcobacteraceae TaxID=2808963 RepID=UPI000DE86857|nr:MULTISPECIES: HDOD domain-containing protein [Arcobacteraceae]MBL3520829.1 HDOD domain-containing protein [Aliarcobacter lanthieri]RBQ27811.1 HDOD domain-containing protein [Arcobacter sp. CECT 9188]
MLQLKAILTRVEALPPLPRTVSEIEEFRRKSDKEITELLKIIEKDALIVTNLLKISNSAMFGFRSKVETPLRAISLLGINFTVSIAISTSTQKLLKSNLEPYGVTNNDFMRSSNISSVLANLWLNNFEPKLKEEIILPALLHDIGKFILADFIKSENKEEEFREKIKAGESSIEDIEREFFGVTTSYVTAQVFKHWKLSSNLINSIEFIDDVNSVHDDFKKIAQILDVIKTVATITDPLSDKSIEKAIKKAKLYNLDTNNLQNSIKTLQTRVDEVIS